MLVVSDCRCRNITSEHVMYVSLCVGGNQSVDMVFNDVFPT
jgi:hypothetical protein